MKSNVRIVKYRKYVTCATPPTHTTLMMIIYDAWIDANKNNTFDH